MLARGEADARLSPRRRRFHGDADDYVGGRGLCRLSMRRQKPLDMLRMGSEVFSLASVVLTMSFSPSSFQASLSYYYGQVTMIQIQMSYTR